MFLKNIELVNFKCHAHLKLDFNTPDSEKPIRKSTFLLGENGTGKSALLKAIALVTAGSNALADLIGDADSWVQNKKKYCEIKAIIVTADGEERNIGLRINRGWHISDIIKANRETLERLDDAIKKADRNYFILAYGASRRLNRGDDKIFSKQSFRTSPRTNCIQSLFNPDAPLVSLTNWALNLDYTSGGSQVKIIRDALNHFLVENVKFKNIDRKKGVLLFTTPDGIVPLEHLSDGYQNVAAWVGDLMYNITNTFKDYKDPLHARGVLLIDEVDLHLHPKWQRRLHEFLNSKLPNFQIIVTTHSPLTAQQARECELYALVRTNGTIELKPFIGDPAKMLLSQILMSPVFGLETDESVVVERTKDRIRELSTKETITSKEKQELKKLADKAGALPLNVRKNAILDRKDVKLLEVLNQKLKVKLQ
ncbi:MAG TPA: AAA family ATPase [Parafilimonas sp.]|nr:AAA family ATPase [Parafilimonas sp.]